MMRRACDKCGPSTAANASTSAKATRASSRVKPACPLPLSGRNRDAAGEPIDTNFIFGLVARQFQHGSGRPAVREEPHHGPPPRPRCIDAQDVEHYITRNRHDVAVIADQNASLPVNRHLALPPCHHCAQTLAPKQSGGFQRQRLELTSSGARHHRDGKRCNQSDDQHDGCDFDEGEAGPSIDRACSRCRPCHCASSVMLNSALMIDTISVPIAALTTIIVAGPLAPYKNKRPPTHTIF